jgi:hypothetical protein
LASKLVTWEPDDFKIIGVCGLDFLVKLLEPGKLLCETALAGRVDYENHFIGKFGEGVRVAFLCLELERNVCVVVHGSRRWMGWNVRECMQHTIGRLEIEEACCRRHGCV